MSQENIWNKNLGHITPHFLKSFSCCEFIFYSYYFFKPWGTFMGSMSRIAYSLALTGETPTKPHAYNKGQRDTLIIILWARFFFLPLNLFKHAVESCRKFSKVELENLVGHIFYQFFSTYLSTSFISYLAPLFNELSNPFAIYWPQWLLCHMFSSLCCPTV